MKKWMIMVVASWMISVISVHADSIDIKKSTKEQLVNSLNRLAPTDTTRFSIYMELIDTSDSLETEVYYSQKMLEDAEALNNDYYKCQAYYQQLVLAYNQYEAENVGKWMKRLEPIARKNKYYYYLFNGRRAAIDMLMINGEYEKEEKEANKMLQDAKKLNYTIGVIGAYICLGNVYTMTYRGKEATEVFEKAYLLALENNNSKLAIQISNQVINTYQMLENNVNLLKWIKIADNYLQELQKKEETNKEELKGWLMLTSIAYVNYYTNTSNLQQAAIYMKQAEELEKNSYGTYARIYHSARFNYFYKAELWEEALAEIDALAEIFKAISPDSYSSTIFLKANTLAKLNREDEALDTYKNAFQIYDSIKIVLLNRQTEQLKKDYDTYSLTLENEKLNRKIQTLFLGVVILVIAILIAFAIHTVKIRQGLRKSEEEMRKMAKEMDAANVAKENFLSTISTSISVPLNEVVKGSLQLATDEVTEKEERKAISQKLNQTSAELMELINSILNLSKLEAGMMKLKFEKVEVMPFIKSIVNTTIANGTKIWTEYEEVSDSMKIKVDTALLQDAFTHLLIAVPGTGLAMNAQVVADTKREICFRITGSILAAHYQEQPQEIAMANEVNRLLIEAFGGKYKVDTEKGSICFVLPLAY